MALFPFMIQVYINGRELMKHRFDENGISYNMYDNSFFKSVTSKKRSSLLTGVGFIQDTMSGHRKHSSYSKPYLMADI